MSLPPTDPDLSDPFTDAFRLALSTGTVQTVRTAGDPGEALKVRVRCDPDGTRHLALRGNERQAVEIAVLAGFAAWTTQRLESGMVLTERSATPALATAATGLEPETAATVLPAPHTVTRAPLGPFQPGLELKFSERPRPGRLYHGQTGAGEIFTLRVDPVDTTSWASWRCDALDVCFVPNDRRTLNDFVVWYRSVGGVVPQQLGTFTQAAPDPQTPPPDMDDTSPEDDFPEEDA